MQIRPFTKQTKTNVWGLSFVGHVISEWLCKGTFGFTEVCWILGFISHCSLKLQKQFWKYFHCIKGVRIQSYSGPYFPYFHVSLRIQSPYSVRRRENVDQNNSEYRHFLSSDFQILVLCNVGNVFIKNRVILVRLLI